MPSYTASPSLAIRPDRPAWTAAKTIGDDGERIAASFFRALGLLVNQERGLAAHDLTITGSIECKNDKRAISSGSVALETSFKGRPSGIATSTASAWAFVVGSELFLIPAVKLRELVANGHYRCVAAGENAVCALVPLEHIRAISQSITIPGAK